MSFSEKEFADKSRVFLAEEIRNSADWIKEVVSKLTGEVYITIDLDALDPSIMPSTGTPEPGGGDWYRTLRFLRRVFAERDVVAADIVELAPTPGLPAPDFLVARLAYKLLSYRFQDRLE